MYIGSVIRLIRKAKKLTLEDLAFSAGTTASYISRIEKNKNNLSPELLDNIAAALNVSVANIYAEAERQLGCPSQNLNLPAIDLLTKRQKQLLEDYESITEDGREIVDVLIKAIKKQTTSL